MVVVIQRMVQKVIDAQNMEVWDKLDAVDKKFNELEKKLGYPQNKKRLRCLFGSLDSNTIVIEYEWTSLGKMERTMTKAFLDPEYQKLNKELEGIIESSTIEIYTPIISLGDLSKAKE